MLPLLGYAPLRLLQTGDCRARGRAGSVDGRRDRAAGGRRPVPLRTARNHYEFDANRELLGLGGANIIGGLTQACPGSSSGSRTAVADANGVGSQAAGGLTATIGSEYLFPTVRAAVKALGERAGRDTVA